MDDELYNPSKLFLISTIIMALSCLIIVFSIYFNISIMFNISFIILIYITLIIMTIEYVNNKED